MGFGILRDEAWVVRKRSAKRSLGQRIVALAAAYAIALSSLLASFGAAQAAAGAAGAPIGVICHTPVTGEAPSPTGDPTNGDHCANNCCVGCLMLMAALPPPSVTTAGMPQAAGRPLSPPAIAVLAAGQSTKSNRSRAPPLTA
jgi:hypothetical protein